jgi:hypothetical protein
MENHSQAPNLASTPEELDKQLINLANFFDINPDLEKKDEEEFFYHIEKLFPNLLTLMANLQYILIPKRKLVLIM